MCEDDALCLVLYCASNRPHAYLIGGRLAACEGFSVLLTHKSVLGARCIVALCCAGAALVGVQMGGPVVGAIHDGVAWRPTDQH